MTFWTFALLALVALIAFSGGIACGETEKREQHVDKLVVMMKTVAGSRIVVRDMAYVNCPEHRNGYGGLETIVQIASIGKRDFLVEVVDNDETGARL